MKKKTEAFIAFTIGAFIGTNYSLYQLYKYADELEKENTKLHWDFVDLKTEHSYLKTGYKTLYDHMTDAELLQLRLNFPLSVPPFINL